MQCLLSYRTDDDHDMPLTFRPGFEFIAGPIQGLFKNHPPSLTSILKMLSVLAIRFRRTYVHTSEMDWNRRFETSVPFIDDLFASISASDLARTLTNLDEEDFSGLSRQNIINDDVIVRDLIAKWNALSTAVWECCTALPELTGYIQECVQVSLFFEKLLIFEVLLLGWFLWKFGSMCHCDPFRPSFQAPRTTKYLTSMPFRRFMK